MIYNDDTGPARASPVPLSPEQYIAEQAAPLAGMLVDTLAVDTTAGSFAVFGHRTEVGQMFLTTRARAMAAWAAGIDGIATFNLEVTDRDSGFWRELGDLDVLCDVPETYFASYQGVSSSRSYFPAGAYLQLPSLSPNSPEQLVAGASRVYEL